MPNRTRITRRAGLALVASGAALALPQTRSFASTAADRLADVDTAPDPDALLGLEGLGAAPRDEVTVRNNADGPMEVTVATDAFAIENGGAGGSWTFSLAPGVGQVVDFAPDTANVDDVTFAAVLTDGGAEVGSIELQRTISIPTTAGTTYRIRNVHSGLFLTADAPGGGGGGWPPWGGPPEEPGDVYQDTWQGTDDQRWILQDDGDASLLEHVSSGALLTVGDPAGGNDFEDLVTEDPPGNGNPGDESRWTLIQNGNGNYRIESVAAAPDVVDVEGESTAPGANVIAYPWKGESSVPNQMWTFEPA